MESDTSFLTLSAAFFVMMKLNLRITIRDWPVSITIFHPGFENTESMASIYYKKKSLGLP